MRRGALQAQVDPDHLADTALAAHHIDRKVVEGAAVAEQVAVGQHRRQRARDGDAGQQRLQQAAVGDDLLAGLAVVAGHTEEGLPQIFGVDVAAAQADDRGLHDAPQPPPGDQRHQGQPIEVAGGLATKGRAGHGQGLVQRLVDRRQRRHHRADAGATDHVDLDAFGLQRLQDAQMGQAACAATGQHQAHRRAGLQAGQACHVAVERGADVQVAVQRAARRSSGGCAAACGATPDAAAPGFQPQRRAAHRCRRQAPGRRFRWGAAAAVHRHRPAAAARHSGGCSAASRRWAGRRPTAARSRARPRRHRAAGRCAGQPGLQHQPPRGPGPAAAGPGPGGRRPPRTPALACRLRCGPARPTGPPGGRQRPADRCRR